MDSIADPFAVVDIGSNTVKFSIFACRGSAPPDVLYQEFDTVRVGYGLSATGRISDDRASRLIAALQRMERTARELGASRFSGIATQAFRQASNGEQVRNRILELTSWPIEIVSGDKEAELTMEAARSLLQPDCSTIIADIGGASTEIVVISAEGDLISSESIAVGSGSLYDDHICASPPPPGTLATARNVATDRMKTFGLLPDRIEQLLLPGGNGQLLQALLDIIDPTAAFDSDGLELLHDWLSTHEGNATADRLNIQLERAHVLPAGLAIVEALVALLQPHIIRIIPSGVGLGIAWSICMDRNQESPLKP